ncbi:uncharacterized protein LOC133792422 [Humulus lupulus]|uniref:uncharacterized protein LOC133792422 n=1 Tax=Humulus lupulus TaxID=3486 RepID=UPI002B417B22|nr:uncharacterized protein LOC133792422 [Humulus lupulus]
MAVLDVCRLNKFGIGALLETKIKGMKIKEVMCSTFVGWDYYSSLSLEDRLGGRPILVKETEVARKWLDLGMADELKIMGSFYTWSNNQEGGKRIFSKLDRVFTNEAWLDLFLLVSAVSHWEVISDHCFILLKQLVDMRMGVKSFRFYNMWASHPRFRETVLASWSKPLQYEGRGLEQIVWKLTRLKHVLKYFNWQVMGDVACNYERSKILYQHAKTNLLADLSNNRLNSEERDAYFLKKRIIANRIVSFIDDDGQVEDDYNKVIHHFLQNFKNFLGAASKASGRIDPQVIAYGPVLGLEAQIQLIKPFTYHEVKAALFSIHSIKSPGPDGYGAGFFKALWKDIGKEVSMDVLNFFDSGSIPHYLNNTIISLIPKVDHLVSAADFRPIACFYTLQMHFKNDV